MLCPRAKGWDYGTVGLGLVVVHTRLQALCCVLVWAYGMVGLGLVVVHTRLQALCCTLGWAYGMVGLGRAY